MAFAEDYLSAVDMDASSSSEASTKRVADGEEEGDTTDLMQRHRRPWQSRGTSSTDNVPRRRRGGRGRHAERETERQRSRERRDRETNAHRPWRSSSWMSAAASTAATPPWKRTAHPARVEGPEGMANLGIHAWHVLLNMSSPMECPPDLSYGLLDHQRTNIEASLRSMTMAERAHMMTSFAQFIHFSTSSRTSANSTVRVWSGISTGPGCSSVQGREESWSTSTADSEAGSGAMGPRDRKEASTGSGVTAEVAEIAEDIMETVEVTVEQVEDDHTTLMEKFVVRASTSSRRSVRDETDTRMDIGTLFTSPVEMELRTLVSALELAPATVSQNRTRALLQRTRLRFGLNLGGRDDQPQEVLLLESALVTFLPEDDTEDDDVFSKLPAQDQDFVEFWWGLLWRKMRSHDASAGVAKPEPWAGHVAIDQGDYELAEEELRLMKELERQERRRNMVEDATDKDIQAYQDSQECDARAQEAQRERASQQASQYRDWEGWEVQQAMQPEMGVPGHTRLQLQGMVNEGTKQTMSWQLCEGDVLNMRVVVQQSRACTQDQGTQSQRKYIFDGAVQTEDGEDRSGSKKRRGCEPREVYQADEGSKGRGRADEQGLTSEGRDVEGLTATASWGTALQGSKVVTIEDSQLPE